MKQLSLAVTLICLVATVGAVNAAPGDPRIITGSMEWPATLTGERFIVIRGDDGAQIYVEVAEAERRIATPLNAGDRISIVAVEGERPYELRARLLGPAAAAPAAFPAPPPDAETAWERIDGRVQVVSGSDLTLRDDDGETLSVDISGLAGRESVRVGAKVTVFGVREEEGQFVVRGLVSQESPEDAIVSSPPGP